MYKITLSKEDMSFDMPFETDLSFLNACNMADIFKERNSKAVFSVVNDSGDIEYQV